MMYRTAIVGVVALVAFVQAIRCATIESTQAVDIVAQKLEDHHGGLNLDNKITLDECKAAFDDFDLWKDDPDTYRKNIHEGKLAVARDYLSDFLHKYLEQDVEGRLTEEFVEKLEGNYEKARPSYIHKKTLPCEAGVTTTPKTCLLIASLSQTSAGQPLKPELFHDSWEEMNDISQRMFAISMKGNIFEDTDEFLRLFRVYSSPEVDVTQWEVMSLLTIESQDKLDESDPEEIQKYMETYKTGLARYLALAEE